MTKLLTIALATAGLLALPAAGQASDSFGSLLKNAPANGSTPCIEDTPGACTLVGYIHPNAVGDPVTSPAPYDGVVVKVRVRSSAAERVTFRFASIGAPLNEVASARITAQGPTVQLQGTSDIEEYAARVPVKKGVHVALDAPSTSAVYNQGGDKFTYLYSPTLSLGGPARASTGEPTGQLLVQAVIERDADRDGLGDETQDACVCTDTTKPRLRGVQLRSGVLHYRLSEPAKVTVRVQRAHHGHFRFLRGKLTDKGTRGANELRLRRKLGEGRYRLVLVARDKAGNVSAAKRIGFRIDG
jgi:hypothetical protein